MSGVGFCFVLLFVFGIQACDTIINMNNTGSEGGVLSHLTGKLRTTMVVVHISDETAVSSAAPLYCEHNS